MKSHLYRSLNAAHVAPVRQPTGNLAKALRGRLQPPNVLRKNAPPVQAKVTPVKAEVPHLAEPGAVTPELMDRLERDASVETIRRVHATGGFQIGIGSGKR